MASVRLDGRLRELGPGPSWESRAPSVAGLLDELEAGYPGLRTKLRDGSGALLRHLRVTVNGEDVRNGEGIGTPLGPSDHVEILPSAPGG